MAEIKMRRTQHKGSFLVVEGKDDVRFWRPRLHETCRLIDGKGKNNVVHGFRRLDEIGLRGVLGVVDSNHDYLTTTLPESPNLLATDAHDLECMLCRSGALERLLAEHGEPDKIEQFQRRSGEDVRTALLRRGLAFGRLRWVARLTGHVGVGRITPSGYVDDQIWAVDEQRLVLARLPQLRAI